MYRPRFGTEAIIAPPAGRRRGRRGTHAGSVYVCLHPLGHPTETRTVARMGGLHASPTARIVKGMVNQSSLSFPAGPLVPIPREATGFRGTGGCSISE